MYKITAFSNTKDMKTSNFFKKLFRYTPETPKTDFVPKAPEAPPEEPDLAQNIFLSCAENLTFIRAVYSLPQNSDIKVREFLIGQSKKAFLLFVEGLVRDDSIGNHILAPLMLLPQSDITPDKLNDQLLLNNQVTQKQTFADVFSEVNMGNCLVFVEGFSSAFSVDVKGWERRGIDSPITEHVIYGPHEGFNENFKVNTALIRKNLRNENLVCETLSLGKQSKTPCALLYIKNVTNMSLVKEMKRRLRSIDADFVYQAGEVEQFIEDASFALSPQFLTTERPDKTASALVEGKVAIIVHGSPFALIAPVAFTEFLTSPEDQNVRFPFANLMKGIRLLGILSSFLLSGIYIAIVNFHHEMIPPDLLFAIESARESVPFSALFEILLMEIAFDIIREASLRVPSPIGSTVGIIGGLIVGQAAVSANLVSPLAIIIVSLTGIGSFATPNYALNFTFRFARYLYILLGASFGFLGITAGLFLHATLLSEVKSLGVSLFTTLASDDKKSLLSFLFQPPAWKKESRHSYVQAQQTELQAKISRKWVE
ncbi:MAG: spore germination protein [Clostridia bacterium]|nr:spore germination protein [Clostridia bacterium]